MPAENRSASPVFLRFSLIPFITAISVIEANSSKDATIPSFQRAFSIRSNSNFHGIGPRPLALRQVPGPSWASCGVLSAVVL